jgi:copper chaperone
MTLQFTVPSMACAACVSTITQAIHSVDPEAEVSGDPKTKQVKVETVQAEAKVRDAIASSGYPVQS